MNEYFDSLQALCSADIKREEKMQGFSYDDVAHYARHMGCSHTQALRGLIAEYERDQEEREMEDMRQFIIDGGLWLLRDDDPRDVATRCLFPGEGP
jgi:hypothetical protein